ncbi:MAG: TIGR00725 family protein [Desulfatitalea sp.]|nr:TIGR00725 family protein [Desulfatitalea sp.]
MRRPLIVGVMGGATADAQRLRVAYRLGALIAAQGWVLLNGGRDSGIMDASAHGAAEAGGWTVGVLPDADATHASPHIRIPICTGMGSARNVINVLSSDIVVACAGGAGTLSEIALALKHGKRVITLGFEAEPVVRLLGPDIALTAAESPEAVIRLIQAHYKEK